MRIVSLLPAATEIVYGLGLEPDGVSHECDYPPAAADQPAITRNRVEATGSSETINEQVAEAADTGGVFEIDRATLREADPDLIITQGVCDVCAVDAVLATEAVRDLGLDADVLTIDPHSLDDIFDAISRIGQAVGASEAAATLTRRIKDRIEAVRNRVATVGSRPDVVVLDWMQPPMVAGHWVPELLDIAGGISAITDPGDRSVPHEWSTIRETDPAVLLVAPCGFTPEQTRENLDDLVDRDGWASLTAVETGRAFVMDGHHHLNRPGPRLAETLEHLAGLLHPALADPPRTVAYPIQMVETGR